MAIVVTGATGFIGLPLCRRLAQQGDAVRAFTRHPQHAPSDLGRSVRFVGWGGAAQPTKEMVEALGECDAIINLAGAPVAASRWTASTKNLLRSSRVGTTKALVRAMGDLQPRPRLIISASAIGYYGPRQDELLAEDAPSGTGFLAGLCRDWEAAALESESLGLRVILLRLGVVLGNGGGALGKMLPPFRLGLGGPLGSGAQWMSWIHLDDVVELITFLLEQPITGPINATAPNPVRNREFSSALGRAVRRPALLPAPGFMMRLLLGEMAEELLLTGQRVLPARAQAIGFRFRYPELAEALHAALR